MVPVQNIQIKKKKYSRIIFFGVNLSKNNSPDIERKNNLPINLLMSTIVNLVN